MITILQKPVIRSNYFKGRFDIYQTPVKPDVIVIHVAVATLQGTFNTFNNSLEQVSSHYCIGEVGEIWQFVEDTDTAWHVGFVKKPTAKLVKERIGKYPNPNSYTLGIENAGEYPGDTTPGDFTEAQYNANGSLVAQLATKWSIPLDRDHIIGHNEIRSDKTCPGAKVSIERIIKIATSYLIPDKVIELKREIQAVLDKY
jgi:N-acetylmuramoyl-L-alanine amidase